MLDLKTATDGIGAVAWFGGIAAASFLVSWILSDVVKVSRSQYVGLLAILTAGLTAGYLLWSDQGVTFWTHNWAWGLLGASVTGAFLALQIGRVPMPGVSAHGVGGRAGLWEGVVYGAVEGLLLSALPVLIVWQGLAALEWTGWLGIGAAAAALAASAVVIVVHHLGYREYRNRSVARPLMACLALSLGYLVTASPITALGGHVVLHLAMLRRGMELPPHTADAARKLPEREREPALAR